MTAAKGGQIEAMNCLIGAGAHVNAVDSNKQTALIREATVGNEISVCVLIQAGADVNMTECLW